jgi:hypothetical protein
VKALRRRIEELETKQKREDKESRAQPNKEENNENEGDIETKLIRLLNKKTKEIVKVSSYHGG